MDLDRTTLDRTGARRLWPALLLALVCLMPALPARAALVDEIAAVAEGRVITRSEVDRHLALQGGAPGDPAAWDKAREQLIDLRLIEEEAQQRGLTATEEEIDAAMETVRQRMGLDPEAFVEGLRTQGMSLKDYRENLRVQLLSRRLAGAVASEEYPSMEALMRAAYAMNRDQYRADAWVRLLHAVLPEEGGMAMAESIRDKVRWGEDFAAAAEAATGEKPRDTGKVELDNLAKAVREAVTGLAAGQVSAPVEAGRAVHLFQVVEQEAGAVRPYEEVAEQVQADLERGGDQKLFLDWLERRKRRAEIERLP